MEQIIIPDNWEYNYTPNFYKNSREAIINLDNNNKTAYKEIDKIELNSYFIEFEKKYFIYNICRDGDTVSNFKFDLDKLKTKPYNFGFAIDKQIVFLTNNPNHIVFTYELFLITSYYNTISLIIEYDNEVLDEYIPISFNYNYYENSIRRKIAYSDILYNYPNPIKLENRIYKLKNEKKIKRIYKLKNEKKIKRIYYGEKYKYKSLLNYKAINNLYIYNIGIKDYVIKKITFSNPDKIKYYFVMSDAYISYMTDINDELLLTYINYICYENNNFIIETDENIGITVEYEYFEYNVEFCQKLYTFDENNKTYLSLYLKNNKRIIDKKYFLTFKKYCYNYFYNYKFDKKNKFEKYEYIKFKLFD